MFQTRFKTHAQQPTTITANNGVLEFRTPFDEALVAALKLAVPGTARKWDKASKAWHVDPQYGATLVMLAQMYLGETVTLPAVTSAPRIETTVLDVRYIGACKPRGSERAAFGWHGGGWNVVLPEAVLRDWFGLDTKSYNGATLYETLGIKQQTAQAEIKCAYYKMAKLYHPDVNQEPDAAEQFKKIQQAHDVLNDAIKRAKYDAGLMLQASQQIADDRAFIADSEWRAPYRCGMLTAEAKNMLGRWNVEKILAWDDIKNEKGETLSVSWGVGADTFTETWVLL